MTCSSIIINMRYIKLKLYNIKKTPKNDINNYLVTCLNEKKNYNKN